MNFELSAGLMIYCKFGDLFDFRFVEEIDDKRGLLHEFHVYQYEDNKILRFSKNTGHDSWLKKSYFEQEYNNYKRYGTFPALIGKQILIINKL